ncbi:MAG: dTMP kinase [Chloroflexi bacterium]|nr:dTMP kinase [Chloroflexota bacterium]
MASPHPPPPPRGQWPGLFIAFEGGDGSGKSVQARALYRRLRRLGLDVGLVAEPGGTPLGRCVRALVTGQDGLALVPRSPQVTSAAGEQLASERIQLPLAPAAELFLFAASRAQLVADVIKPRLERGGIILADRYAPSTLAYQGYGRGLPKALVRRVNELATAGIWPDLIVLLDVPVAVSRRRQQRRGKSSDRFEREALKFHRRVQRGYLAMAAHDPERWAILPGDRPRKEIGGAIWKLVSRLLLKHRPQLAASLRPDEGGPPAPGQRGRRSHAQGHNLKLDL